jgi:hypothetical protein
LYWWNMFPANNQQTENPMRDPFNIPRESNSIYFRLMPPWELWVTVALMKLLIELNIMYTDEKNEEYKLRMAANTVLTESTGKAGYYFKRALRIFVGVFDILVIISLVVVQSLIDPSIISWLFFVLNLVNLSYMIKGGEHRSDLRTQYYISNIIKVYALIVIIVTIFVLANSHKIDHDVNWANFRQWL